ncbi:hypothetical protein BGW38_001708, partial [Lunasporangiospora selenospora]
MRLLTLFGACALVAVSAVVQADDISQADGQGQNAAQFKDQAFGPGSYPSMKELELRIRAYEAYAAKDGETKSEKKPTEVHAKVPGAIPKKEAPKAAVAPGEIPNGHFQAASHKKAHKAKKAKQHRKSAKGHQKSVEDEHEHHQKAQKFHGAQ